jgi:hypothetical protein
MVEVTCDTRTCSCIARVKTNEKVIVLQLKMMIIMMEICGRSNDPKA